MIITKVSEIVLDMSASHKHFKKITYLHRVRHRGILEEVSSIWSGRHRRCGANRERGAGLDPLPRVRAVRGVGGRAITH